MFTPLMILLACRYRVVDEDGDSYLGGPYGRDCNDYDALITDCGDHDCSCYAVIDCEHNVPADDQVCLNEVLPLEHADLRLGGMRRGALGEALAVVPDLLGDGKPALALGAPLHSDHTSEEEGAVFLFSLEDASNLDKKWDTKCQYIDKSSSLGVYGITLDEEGAQGAFGSSMASCTSCIGDSYSDLIVGAPQADLGAGRVLLIRGPLQDPQVQDQARPPFGTLLGESPSDFLGWSVSAGAVRVLPLMRGGRQDVVVGAPNAMNEVGTRGGAVYLVSAPEVGRTEWISRQEDAVVIWGVADSFAGWSVDAKEDLDGDGVDDLLIGAPFYKVDQDPQGGAYLILGPVSGDLELATVSPLNDGGLSDEALVPPRIGWSVASVGDLSGDGLPEFAVGAPQAGDNSHGAVLIYSCPGGDQPCTESVPQLLSGFVEEERFGTTVAAAGDLNGDRIPDLAVGAAGSADLMLRPGSVYLFDGAAWSGGVESLRSTRLPLLGLESEDGAGSAVLAIEELPGLLGLAIGAPNTADYGENQTTDTDDVTEAGATYLLLRERTMVAWPNLFSTMRTSRELPEPCI